MLLTQAAQTTVAIDHLPYQYSLIISVCSSLNESSLFKMIVTTVQKSTNKSEFP